MQPQDHPDILASLAAEYVLGTLRGPARRRFEKWRAASPQVDERCRFWEGHLMQLAKGSRPVRPPPHVWQGIRARLNFEPAVERRRGRSWAIAASVLVLVGLSALIYWRSTAPGRLTEVATIATPAGARLWDVDVYRDSGSLILRTGQLPAHAADRDFELWALPAGGKPVSLGVMPNGGTAQRKLTDIQKQALANSAQVAITVEQLGGSPTGQPTTTPIYVVPLRSAG
ncbi:MAG: anti-sigma factor [Proteobacteria bacterium]|nr:anti-sigma factor [Pseudomonadota bacterium]